MKPSTAEALLWILMILAGLLCFLPLYQINSSSNSSEMNNGNNLSNVLQNDRFFLDSCIFRIAITFVQILDVIIEMCSAMLTIFFPTTAPIAAARPSSLKVTRLKDSERLVFMIGISIISLIFAPGLQDNIHIVFSCIANFSAIATICPTLIYLYRCTDCWGFSATTSVTVVLCVASVLDSASLMQPSSKLSSSTTLATASAVLITIMVSLVGVISLTCFVKYIVSKFPNSCKLLSWNRRNSVSDSELNASIHDMKKYNSNNKTLQNATVSSTVEKSADEFYVNTLPAAHMISVAVLMWMALMRTLGWGYDAYTMGVYNYVHLGLGLFMCALEIRIRKNEVTRSLVEILEDRKVYIRYISHELRTPLNAAFLGLKLLIDQAASGRDSGDQDTDIFYDTLCDVSLSCSTTLDILNDLLCFDKLEAGILKLNQEESPVLPLISESVAMFFAQARERGVQLTTDFDTPDVADDKNDNDSSRGALAFMKAVSMRVVSRRASRVSKNSFENLISTKSRRTMRSGAPHVTRLPLLPHDTVIVDVFKMKQILRNVVSNAVKFTPPGGSVTVSAHFVPDSSSSNQLALGAHERDENNNPILGFMGRLWSRMSRPSLFFASVAPSPQPPVLKPQTEQHPHDLEIGRQQSRLQDDKKQMNVGSTQGKLLITVTDTGAGISAENQKRLFKEIIQFNPEKLQAGGGSGLGLWITKGIVLMHNGQISVYSAGEGKGSTFTVEIPMTRRKGAHAKRGGGERVSLSSSGQELAGACEEPAVKQHRASTETGHRMSGSIVVRPSGSAQMHGQQQDSAVLHVPRNGHQQRGNAEQDGVQGFDPAREQERGQQDADQDMSAMGQNSVEEALDFFPILDGQPIGLAGWDPLDGSAHSRPPRRLEIIPVGSNLPDELCKMKLPFCDDTDGKKEVERDVEDNQPRRIPSDSFFGNQSSGEHVPMRDTSNISPSHHDQHYNSNHNHTSSHPIHHRIGSTTTFQWQHPGNSSAVSGARSRDTSFVHHSDYPSPGYRHQHHHLHHSHNQQPYNQQLMTIMLGSPAEGGSRRKQSFGVGAGAGVGSFCTRTNDGSGSLGGRLFMMGSQSKSHRGQRGRLQSAFGDAMAHAAAAAAQIAGGGGGGGATGIPVPAVGDNAAADGRNNAPKKSKLHILVVDDSRLSRKMLVRVLLAAGHTCDEAEDGVDAVEKVKEDFTRFDCILMDFVMPNMDGPTATKEIRAMGYTAPIFGVTGNAQDFDMEHFIKCGANTVYPKPFNLERFKKEMGLTIG